MKLSFLMVALLGLVVNPVVDRLSPIAKLKRAQTTEASPQLLDQRLLPYTPQAVAVPEEARYVLRDGSISIIGYNDMDGIFSNLNALFTRTHPGFRFTMRLKGTATAAPALTHGVSAFAPMGAEFSALELAIYRSVVGIDPMLFRVAHCSLDPRARSSPLGIFVNKANPIDKLTVEQIERIFTTGKAEGDITHWGQLGLTGEWTTRTIHTYGIAEEAAAGLASFMLNKMGGRPFAFGYDSFQQSADVVRVIGEDPAGIGFASGNLTNPNVKLVAIAQHEGGYFSHMTAEDIVGGKYPFDRYLLIYIRRSPNEPLDPFVKEYLRMIFSKEGQQAIASASPGYLPLNAREAEEELAKLR